MKTTEKIYLIKTLSDEILVSIDGEKGKYLIKRFDYHIRNWQDDETFEIILKIMQEGEILAEI